MSLGFTKTRFGVCAQKVGMSRIFIDKSVYAITLLRVPVSNVLQKKDYKNYSIMTLGIVNSKKINKPQLKDMERKNKPLCSIINEFKITRNEAEQLGDTIEHEWLSIGDLVDVKSKTIGKGFAGGMKKWNFSGQAASHGASLSHRSIGSTGTREKIFKQRKMPGRMGQEYVTIQNQKIVYKDDELKLIGLIGSVPGKAGSWVKIMKPIKGMEK